MHQKRRPLARGRVKWKGRTPRIILEEGQPIFEDLAHHLRTLVVGLTRSNWRFVLEEIEEDMSELLLKAFRDHNLKPDVARHCRIQGGRFLLDSEERLLAYIDQDDSVQPVDWTRVRSDGQTTLREPILTFDSIEGS